MAASEGAQIESISRDTDASAHAEVVTRLRAMTAADRARMVDAIHTDALRLISAGIRADHGAVTPRRLRFLLLERLHGTEYAQLACSVAPDG